MTGFPTRPRSVTVGGLQYAYVDEGCGPPVVLVHGNPSWSYHFRSLLDRLPASGHRAIAPDHIGMGRSAKPTAAAYPHTLARRVADFTDFLAQVVPTGPVTLVVHDWGGAIALAWAVANPERVERLVLFNTAAFPLPAGKGLPLVLRAVRTPPGGLAVRHLNAFALGAALLGVRRRMTAAVRRGYLAPYDRPEHRVAVPAAPPRSLGQRRRGRVGNLVDVRPRRFHDRDLPFGLAPGPPPRVGGSHLVRDAEVRRP